MTNQKVENLNSEIAPIAVSFAKMIGAERYDPTAKEKRQIAALLAAGYTSADIRAALEYVVTREKKRGRSVQTIAYGLPAVKELR